MSGGSNMQLGILGGMGPLATSDFFRKVIQMTDASSDQEHIHILVDNNTTIPDRTDYIINKSENPKRELVRSAIKLEIMGADLIAIPCNTAHYFHADISKYTNIPIVNMIEETAKYLLKEQASQKKYLLLATTGTYASKVYQQTFDQWDLEIIEPNEMGKKTIMKWIYDLKSNQPSATKLSFDKLVEEASNGTCMPVILGCTELPVIKEVIGAEGVFIDPTSILAKKCVQFSKSELKGCFDEATEKGK